MKKGMERGMEWREDWMEWMETDQEMEWNGWNDPMEWIDHQPDRPLSARRPQDHRRRRRLRGLAAAIRAAWRLPAGTARPPRKADLVNSDRPPATDPPTRPIPRMQVRRRPASVTISPAEPPQVVRRALGCRDPMPAAPARTPLPDSPPPPRFPSARGCRPGLPAGRAHTDPQHRLHN